MERKNKRGQLGNLQGIILTLVIVGILLGVGFLVLTSLKTNLQDSNPTVNTVVNETVTPTDAGVYLAYNSTTAGVVCYNKATLTNVINKTGAPVALGISNYSLNPNTGLIKNLSSNSQWLLELNVTYTYNSGDSACEGVQDTINATKTIPDFLPILVIIALVGILLAIVFSVLPKAGGGGGGGLTANV